jgi:hypothetical protein
LGAIEAVAALAKRPDALDVDSVAFVQQEAQTIGSTTTDAYAISGYAFGWARSNLQVRDMEAVLGAFLVKSPWSSLGSVAKRAGFGLPSVRDSFKNAALRRHAAAHDPTTDTRIVDIREFPREAKAIALGFDGVASRSIFEMRCRNADFLSGKILVEGIRIPIRALEIRASGKVAEIAPKNILETKARARKLYDSVTDALNSIRELARNEGELVVCRDASGIPTDWMLPHLD